MEEKKRLEEEARQKEEEERKRIEEEERKAEEEAKKKEEEKQRKKEKEKVSFSIDHGHCLIDVGFYRRSGNLLRRRGGY